MFDILEVEPHPHPPPPKGILQLAFPNMTNLDLYSFSE